MAYALSVYTGSAGFAPSVRAEPAEGLGGQGEFVLRQRARRASWSAIAGMLGASEHAVRSVFDVDYRAPDGWGAKALAARAEAASPPTEPTVGAPPHRQRKPARRFKGINRLTVLAVLAKGAATAKEVAGACRGEPALVDRYLAALRANRYAFSLHLIAATEPVWDITPAGRMMLDARRHVLVALRRAPKSVATMADELGLEARRIADMLQNLAKQGFAVGPGKRGVRGPWRLTEAGRAEAEAVARAAIAGGGADG